MSRLNAEFLKKFWTQETPSGDIDGVNTTYTITYEPLETDAVQVFKNGIVQRLTDDYTFSGTTVTFVDAPATASDIRVHYIRKTGEN